MGITAKKKIRYHKNTRELEEIKCPNYQNGNGLKHAAIFGHRSDDKRAI